MENSTKKQIKIGIIISYISLISSIIIHFFSTPILLRYIGENDFGIRSFSMSIVSYLSLLSFGMSSSYIRFYTKYKKEYGEEGGKKVNSLYFIFFVFASILAISAFFILFLLYKNNVFDLSKYSENDVHKIIIIVIIQTILTILSMLLSVFDLNIVAKERFIFKNSLNLFITIGTFVATIVALILGGNVITITVISTLISILQLVFNAIYCIFVLKIRFSKLKKGDFLILKEILIFSGYIFVIQIVSQLNNESDKIILGLMVGSASVTTYQIGTTFRTYLNTISNTISSSFVPYINKCVENNDMKEVNKIFINTSEVQMFVLLFVVGGFVSCGKQFTIAWIGEEQVLTYYIAVSILSVLTITYSQLTTVEVQRAMNRHKFRAALFLAIAIINVAISILLCSKIGIMGCVIGTVISYIIQNIAMTIYNHKIIGLNMFAYWKKYLFYFIFTAICCCISLLIGHYVVIGDSISQIYKWIETVIIGSIYTFLFLLLQFLFNRKYLKKNIDRLFRR